MNHTLTGEQQMTHTPGPWVVYPGTDGQEVCAVDNKPGLPIRQLIAHCERPNLVANARLIAAAPELLACLKLAADIIGHPDDDASKLIAEVIAKAEGRS